jgi:nitrite reductase (NADH) small subunit
MQPHQLLKNFLGQSPGAGDCACDMSRWVRIASVADCPVASAVERTVEQHVVALVHTADAWYALDGICPHQGGPLGKGVLDGTTLACPWHRWQFDIRSGQHVLRPSLCQRRYPIKIEGSDVFIDLESESSAP